MTVQVPKSVAALVAGDFAAEVESYRQRLLAHRFSAPARGYVPPIPARPEIKEQREKPKKGEKKGRLIVPYQPARPGQPEIPAIAGEPRPTAHPLIEACVRRVPREGQADDFVADYTIIDDTPPPLSLREKKDRLISEIAKQERDATDRVWPLGKQRLDNMMAIEFMSMPEDNREPHQVAFLDEVKSKQEKIAAIQKQSATLMSQIEDLTSETIDNWKSSLA